MIVDCAHYRDGVRQHEGQLPLDVAANCVVGDGDFVWLGLFEPTVDELRDVGERFDLHELALEDAYGAHQRPKLEDYADSYFVVLRPARYDDAKEEVEFGEIMLFLSSTYVIAVRHGAASELKGVRKHLEDHPELLEFGPAAAVWAIVDKVVDDYQPVVEGIDNDITEVETEIFSDGTDSTQRIYFLKREVIEFHHATAPLLAPLEALERGAFPNMDEQLRRYFRDVADHARRVDEQVTAQRELLTSILEANLALLGVRQNEVVRAISAYAAIIAVPTFLASIWGMNFTHMPELDEPWGYWVALAMMAFAVAFLYTFFKRIRWL
ncbi:MAG: magnesium transporter [Solirubrobacterales bacterium]|nr:magnesium transporter [Solirubrobacterales bacterium]